jgi:hypothetical protein
MSFVGKGLPARGGIAVEESSLEDSGDLLKRLGEG